MTKDVFKVDFDKRLKFLLNNPPDGFDVYNSGMYRDKEIHETHFPNYECQFASRMIALTKPETVLDVGSYRQWVIGLMANSLLKVSTLDVRQMPEPLLENEERLVGDIANFSFNNQYDAVVSLCCIEHFGLGRYGDQFDTDADRKGMRNMISAVKAGGHFIFTTTLTGLPK